MVAGTEGGDMIKMRGETVEFLAYHVRNMILIVSDAITSLRQLVHGIQSG